MAHEDRRQSIEIVHSNMKRNLEINAKFAICTWFNVHLLRSAVYFPKNLY